MIGFYLTTTGEYSPEQIEDISNSIILDDRNKTFKVMNQYVFDFQKLSADYDTLTADSSREGLSIYGANAMFDGLDGKISTTESSVNTLEGWKAVVDASIDTIDSSINALEEWKIVVDTSIFDINSSISAIKTGYIPNSSMGVDDGIATLDSSGHVPLEQMPYVQGTVEILTQGISTAPMVWDASVINAYIAVLDANAVRYKGGIDASTGQIDDTSETLTTVANKKGDVYVVTSEGTLCGVDMQVGDSIIFKTNVGKNIAPQSDQLTFVQGTVKVTNMDATLQWGQLTKIANVEGIDISVALPADPAIELVPRIEDISAYAIEVSAYAAEVSTYASDVSSRLATVNTTLTGRIENVSTYAINVSTYAANVSTYAVDVSSRLNSTNATLTNRIANVSTYAINVSTYAADVSSRLATVNTTLTSRIANVSTYAINVSTYAADVSSRLATVNTTLTGRIANVSTYAINVSTYAANVSVNLANDVSIINSHFSNVDSSLVHHDSSIYEIYDNLYELTQVWAAAWYDISTHLSTTDSSLNEHIVETTGYGAFADKPSNPQTGQIYFATDKQTTEGATNGIPIWYNGTNWVDALGRTIS